MITCPKHGEQTEYVIHTRKFCPICLELSVTEISTYFEGDDE